MASHSIEYKHVFYDVMPCRLAERYQQFGGARYLHVKARKTVLLINVLATNSPWFQFWARWI
jgi:hypothetical protein